MDNENIRAWLALLAEFFKELMRLVAMLLSAALFLALILTVNHALQGGV